jgi:hypothetical protein
MQFTVDQPVVSCIGSATFGLEKYILHMICPIFGHSEHRIKNSEALNLSHVSFQHINMLVNFDMALLFTRVPVEATLLLLLQHLNE